jgi:hypothetical protein
METQDYLAFIGRNPMDHDNIYVVTGDSGMGITHGTIAGMLLSDLILGRRIPGRSSTTRRASRCARRPTSPRENSNVALQYADWLTGGDVSRPPTRSRPAAAPSSAADWRRSRCTATRRARCTSATPPARIWAACAVESRRNDLGLPLPRLALRPLW